MWLAYFKEAWYILFLSKNYFKLTFSKASSTIRSWWSGLSIALEKTIMPSKYPLKHRNSQVNGFSGFGSTCYWTNKANNLKIMQFVQIRASIFQIPKSDLTTLAASIHFLCILRLYKTVDRIIKVWAGFLIQDTKG